MSEFRYDINFACPKCESEAVSIVGYDKSLLPRLIDEGFIGIGDYCAEILIHQCGNCGTRFISLNNSGGGFISEISTVTTSDKPKSFKLKLFPFSNFYDKSGSERLEAVKRALSNVSSLKEPENTKEIKPKSRQPKSSGKKRSSK